MKIEKLCKNDLWKRVIYKSFCVGSDIEEWVIKSYSNDSKVAWVVYKCNNDGNNYKNYTWVPTNFCDLSFKKNYAN
jgi:hypothetical protein